MTTAQTQLKYIQIKNQLDEIIDRLYVLNAKRAAEEELQGFTKAATKKKSPKKKIPKKPSEPNPTLDLF